MQSVVNSQSTEPIEIVEAKPRSDGPCAAAHDPISCTLDPAALTATVSAALDLSVLTRDVPVCAPSRQRIDVDPAEVRKGLGQLVLTLVKLLHEVLERQAIRRMDSGTLDEQQVDRLGQTLMLQAEEITKLAKEFGVDEADLNLDLGPLGKLM